MPTFGLQLYILIKATIYENISLAAFGATALPAHDSGWETGAPDEKERRLTMTRRLISTGSTFEAQIGYSRAVVDGDWIFVSGTTGFDYAAMSLADDVVAQAEKALQNIEAALREAGSSLADVVRVTYILPDPEEFPRCWPILRRYFGDIRPAATMISAGLVDKRLRIEIEVTARIRT